jgi:hypothetical protein
LLYSKMYYTLSTIWDISITDKSDDNHYDYIYAVP